MPPFTGLLMLGLGGCVSFHPAGPIGAPSETAQSTYPHAVQVEEVQITDRKITNADWRRTVSAALTQQIGQHVERGEYFERLISFPAKVEGNDVVLKFSFSSLEGKRTPHPGYVPGALLTLTAWIWVNGPIYVDKYDLVGDLLIENAEGKALASSHKALDIQQNTGLWDRDYAAFSLGSVQLTQLVESLLKDATAQLPCPEGRSL
ncbi:hypothetical protein ACIUV1_26255 [Pseudomonas aeruginosa]|uniref:hypothetical protein n=1 Tax=Pseudomonas aeruginosa TaxID=287 RepID=UPI0035E3D17F